MDVMSKDLQTILEAIKNRVQLKHLFLFGSYAEGRANTESDLDLCIVAETDKSKIEALREIRIDLYAKVTSPIDFLFFTPDEFETRSKVPKRFEWQIQNRGQLIYG